MTEISTYQQYIDGRWVDSVTGLTYGSENPYTQQIWAQVPDSSAEDINLAVAAAHRAFEDGPWATLLPQQRARHLRDLARLCEENGPRIARLESNDNGKLVTEQTLQWMLIAELLYYWAGYADKLNGTAVPSPLPLPVAGLPLPESFVYTRREPIGVVGAITPWNSPANQLSFKFGPAMAAGCTMVSKPSEHTPVSALEFAKLVDQAEFPPGVFNVVTSCDRDTGAALVRHPDVKKISFTGSTSTGKEIARVAADNLTRVTSELGGKSPNIIFADADIEKAVKGTIAGIFAAAGQTCMAGSRVLVQDSLHDEFVAALVAAAEATKLGDPLDPTTQMGPLSNRANYEKVLSYFNIAAAEGVTIACGGVPDDLGGYFVRPTVLTDVKPDMRIAREEIFGPVASVMRFTTEEEALAMANDTEYGLAGAVFTENPARAHRVAHKIRAGTVWINTYRLVTHLAPFGGYGSSGSGREGSAEGIDGFLETKAVWVPTE